MVGEEVKVVVCLLCHLDGNFVTQDEDAQVGSSFDITGLSSSWRRICDSCKLF